MSDETTPALTARVLDPNAPPGGAGPVLVYFDCGDLKTTDGLEARFPITPAEVVAGRCKLVHLQPGASFTSAPIRSFRDMQEVAHTRVAPHLERFEQIWTIHPQRVLRQVMHQCLMREMPVRNLYAAPMVDLCNLYFGEAIITYGERRDFGPWQMERELGMRFESPLDAMLHLVEVHDG